MNKDKRLDKVEGALTPKQAVMLWLDEIRPHKNARDYIRFLDSQPKSEAPITRLTYQIDEAVRESMKGQHKDTVQRAARRAVRDVVFLIKLHHQVNRINDRTAGLQLVLCALAEKFKRYSQSQPYMIFWPDFQPG